MSLKPVIKILPICVCMLPMTGFAETLYKAVLPDGRIIYTDNADSAYQQTHNASKITVLDNIGAKNNAANVAVNGNSNPAITNNTTISNNSNSVITAQSSPLVRQSPSINTNPMPDATPNPDLANSPNTSAATDLPTATITGTAKRMPASNDEFVPLNISSTKFTKTGDYQLSVQTPDNDMVYHRPASMIEIKTTVSPMLNAVDNVVFSIDGVEIGRNQTGNFTLPSYEVTAGEHTLTVSILNVMNEPVASVTRKFYVIIQNSLIKQKRQLATQMAAYEALPWYEKLAVHLGIASK